MITITKRPYKKVNIEQVINSRLNLQSTQNQLFNNFGIHVPSVAYVEKFITTGGFDGLNEEEQKEFIRLIGGPVNFKRTNQLINEFKNE